ncbi:MAG: hypothetical protein IKQ29_03475 [Bacilli bacterium]|nr:hypothetical protein [Bacilli bacterium]
MGLFKKKDASKSAATVAPQEPANVSYVDENGNPVTGPVYIDEEGNPVVYVDPLTEETGLAPNVTGLTMEAPNQMGQVPPQATAIANSTAAQIETPQPIVEQQIAYNINPQEMFEGGETKEDVIANTVLNSVTGNNNVLEPAAPIAAEQPVVNSIPAEIVEPIQAPQPAPQTLEQPAVEQPVPQIQEVQPAPAATETPVELTISPLTVDNSLTQTPEAVVQPETTNTIVETNQIVEQPAPTPVEPIIITSGPTESDGIPTIDSVQTTNIIEMINDPAPAPVEEAAPIVIQPNVIAEPVIENVQGLSNPEPTPEEPTTLAPVINVEPQEPTPTVVSSEPVAAPVIDPNLVVETPATPAEEKPAEEKKTFTSGSIGPSLLETLNAMRAAKAQNQASANEVEAAIASPTVEIVAPMPEEPIENMTSVAESTITAAPVIAAAPVETSAPAVENPQPEVMAPVIDPNLVVETPATPAEEKPAEEKKTFTSGSIGPSLLETLNAMRAARANAGPVTEPAPTEAPVTETPAPTEAPAPVEEAPVETPAPAEVVPTEVPVAAPVEQPVMTPLAPVEAPVVETPVPTEVVQPEMPAQTPVVQEPVVEPVPEVQTVPTAVEQPVQPENQIVTPIESAIEQNVISAPAQTVETLEQPVAAAPIVEAPMVPAEQLVEQPIVQEPVPAPVETVPVETPAPTEVPAPVEVAPVETPAPAEVVPTEPTAVVPEQPVIETPVAPTEVPVQESVAESTAEQPIIPLTPVDSFATQSSQINQEVENLFGNTPEQVQESTIVEQPVAEQPIVPPEVAPIEETVVAPEQPVVETPESTEVPAPVEVAPAETLAPAEVVPTEVPVLEETTPVVEEVQPADPVAETPVEEPAPVVEESTPVVEEPKQEEVFDGPIIEETKEENIFTEDNGIFTPTPKEEPQEEVKAEVKEEPVIDGPIIEETKEDNIFTSNEEEIKEETKEETPVEVEEPKKYPSGSLGPSLKETLEKMRNAKVEPKEDTEEAKEYPVEETKQEPEKKLTGIDLLMSSNPVTSTRFCDKCGAMLGVEDQTICPNCGEPIE